MLRIEKLEKRYDGCVIISGLDLHVERGECLALFGPSGCGKTTLLRLIAGLEEADGGTIAIDGTISTDPRVIVPPHKRGIGMVFQDLALWPHMTALAHVEFMLPASVKRKSERWRRADAALETAHLPGKNRCYPHELSGGEQQRLALARALAGEPRLLLLDEPFSSLDIELKDTMLEIVREIHAERSLTTVYVTHIPGEVASLSKQVALMDGGRINDILPVDDFMNRYGGVSR